MKKRVPNQRHLSPDNRNFIETSLNENHLIKEIASFLSKDPTTISKEIKRNRTYKQASKFGGFSNVCISRYACEEDSVCGDKTCLKTCSSCHKCNTTCRRFKPEICPTQNRAPYVCNGCPKKTSCRLVKYYYRSKDAQSKYESLLSSSREGINISEDELHALNELAVPLIKRGQPVAHIFAKHSNEIPCTKRTFYSYVQNGVLSIGNIDLRRKVRYKKRKIKKVTILRRNSKLLVGRKYEDFKNYLSVNHDAKVVEMDTVEGVKGGKVLLTLFFRETKLMIMIILKDKTQHSVITALRTIEESVGTEIFRQTFPIILTDNGSEFLDPESLEKSCDGEQKRTTIYYCDPYSSFQKGGIEKNHEYIRYVVPKGNSLNNYTQLDIDLLMNHVNSTTRDNLNSRAPMELAQLLINVKVLEILNLTLIPHDEVYLKPNLLRGGHKPKSESLQGDIKLNTVDINQLLLN